MIKYIDCYGTSYTAGGGFEWGSRDESRNELLKNYYSNVKLPKRQFEFSWPGHLSRLLKSNGYDIKVNNYAKSGFGNEYMVRKVIEQISNPTFKKEEHLLMLEFSGLGRKELYSRKLKSHVVFNYSAGDIYNTDNWDVAKHYFYHSPSEISTLLEHREKVINFYEDFLDEDQLGWEVCRNNMMFVNMLILHNINFVFTTPPLFAEINPMTSYMTYLTEIDMEKKYPSKYHFCFDREKKEYDFVKYYHDAGLSIENETNGGFQDGHLSLKGADIISNIFYEQLKEKQII